MLAALVDLVVVVRGQELAGVVTAEAKGHLSQVVGTEGEELRFGGDLIGGQRSAGDLDHGAHQVLHVHTGSSQLLVSGLDHHVLDELQLLGVADQRDHDLGDDSPIGVLLLHVDGGADDGSGLHLGDLRVGDGQTAATVAHHRVELVQGGDDGLDVGYGLAHILGQQLDVVVLGRDELVQGGIKEADGDGEAFHGLVDALEVALLHGQQLGQSLLALLLGVGADHLADGGDTVALEEHVLGTAQADTLGAQRAGAGSVGGSVGVGAHLQPAELVRPGHDAAEIAAHIGVHGGHSAIVDAAGRAVQTHPVALVIGLAGQGELLVGLVHVDRTAAGDAALAHAARHNSRVGGHTAADGQDALGGLHSLDVLGRGLQTNQNHLLAPRSPLLGVLGVEHDLAAGSAGGGGQRLAHRLGGLQRLGVELGMQQGVQVTRVDHGHGLLLGDHALVDEVAGDLQRGGRGALAVAALEHIELAVLDGELHILHIAIVVLKDIADLHEVGIGLGELLSHLGNGHGGAHTGHHVLALGVGQKLAHQLLLAGGGVTGKGHARAAVVAHVAEGHGLHVDGGAQKPPWGALKARTERVDFSQIAIRN